MSFPQTLLVEVPTDTAERLLAFFDGVPSCDSVIDAFLRELRGDVNNARAQASMFGDVA